MGRIFFFFGGGGVARTVNSLKCANEGKKKYSDEEKNCKKINDHLQNSVTFLFIIRLHWVKRAKTVTANKTKTVHSLRFLESTFVNWSFSKHLDKCYF